MGRVSRLKSTANQGEWKPEKWMDAEDQPGAFKGKEL